jgi:two-component system OmpR family sensor kinase
MLRENCDMWLSNTSMQLKSEILNSYMKKEPFNPVELKDKNLKYALYDKNRKLIYSYLQNEDCVDLDKSIYKKKQYDFYITTLNEEDIPIKYIVLETFRNYDDENKLKLYMLVVFLLASIFIGFVAYFLAKLLLKPVREKVEHLDRFIKDSAHELNTPISVLMTSVSMLKKGKNPEKMMRYISSSAKQISQIYNDIHFSAFNELNEDLKESFDLKDLVSESCEYFNDIAITKNINIETFLEETSIKMDKTKTQKLINNLVSNAIKYSKKDSKIIVRLNNNIFEVQDFGIGIDEKEQKNIFKRYKRGENIEGGFGIGLDIVKRICEEYNLVLDLKSQINEGSIFTIEFSKVMEKIN